MAALHRYVFVFRDPLDRTSLPLAELAAVTRKLHGPISISYGQPNDMISENPLRVSDFGCSEAIIIPWAQSAVVLSTVPLRIPDIVARSGYAHSGGPLVYCTAWPEADANRVIDQCMQYLKDSQHSAAKLVWYTKAYVESHKRADGSPRADLHPLGPLEIDEKRYHLGDRPFKEEAQRIIQALPRGGRPALLYAYRDVTNDGAARSSYLRYRERSHQDWLIIYETQGKKENPVHDLDDREERKLFWAGIFTTPHRLINAMLNLCEVGEGSLVLDPFAHTGTVAIEAAQLGATTRSFDVSEVRGAQDNFEFFCSPNPGEDLSSIEESLKRRVTQRRGSNH